MCIFFVLCYNLNGDKNEKQYWLAKIDEYLERKIEEGKNKVVCPYFEVKTQVGVLKDDENEFLRLARNKLENKGYDVYFTFSNYIYKGKEETVGINDFIVAIKN